MHLQLPGVRLKLRVVCRAMLPELLPDRLFAQPVLQEEQSDHPPRRCW